MMSIFVVRIVRADDLTPPLGQLRILLDLFDTMMSWRSNAFPNKVLNK